MPEHHPGNVRCNQSDEADGTTYADCEARQHRCQHNEDDFFPIDVHAESDKHLVIQVEHAHLADSGVDEYHYDQNVGNRNPDECPGIPPYISGEIAIEHFHLFCIEHGSEYIYETSDAHRRRNTDQDEYITFEFPAHEGQGEN